MFFLSAFGKPTLGGGGGGFGTFGQPGQMPMLGQPLMQQQQLQQQPVLNPDEAFAESIYNVSIFGDERDIVIAKWNYLQAMWGSGKAFYAKNLPPVEITPQNVWQKKLKFISLLQISNIKTIYLTVYLFVCCCCCSFYVVSKRSVTVKFQAKIIKWAWYR